MRVVLAQDLAVPLDEAQRRPGPAPAKQLKTPIIALARPLRCATPGALHQCQGGTGAAQMVQRAAAQQLQFRVSPLRRFTVFATQNIEGLPVQPLLVLLARLPQRIRGFGDSLLHAPLPLPLKKRDMLAVRDENRTVCGGSLWERSLRFGSRTPRPAAPDRLPATAPDAPPPPPAVWPSENGQPCR